MLSHRRSSPLSVIARAHRVVSFPQVRHTPPSCITEKAADGRTRHGCLASSLYSASSGERSGPSSNLMRLTAVSVQGHGSAFSGASCRERGHEQRGSARAAVSLKDTQGSGHERSFMLCTGPSGHDHSFARSGLDAFARDRRLLRQRCPAGRPPSSWWPGGNQNRLVLA